MLTVGFCCYEVTIYTVKPRLIAKPGTKYKSYICEIAGLAVNRGLHISGHCMGHNPLYTIHVPPTLTLLFDSITVCGIEKYHEVDGNPFAFEDEHCV